MKSRLSFAVAVLGTCAISAPAGAEVLDATYRGTLVCKHSDLTKLADRAAFEADIKGNAVTYKLAVRGATFSGSETGTGTVDGDKLTLKGSFTGKDQGYQATYSGTIKRRTFTISGKQNWSVGGKAFTRECSGAIKRPFKPLIPKDKKA